MTTINAESAIIAISGLIFIGIGLALHRLAGKLVRGQISRKNYMGRGFKIKEALASDEAWYRINREGGKQMILPSLIVVALGMLMALFGVLLAIFEFLSDTSLLIYYIAMAVAVLVMVVPPIRYVIWIKRNERKNKAA
jgi:hypothetical protein